MGPGNRSPYCGHGLRKNKAGALGGCSKWDFAQTYSWQVKPSSSTKKTACLEYAAAFEWKFKRSKAMAWQTRS